MATGVKLSDLEIELSLYDDAKGACWTNLGEVREYAEEKLYSRGVKKIKGIKIDNTDHYLLNIHVIAKRIFEGDSGPCAGHVKITVLRFAKVNDRTHVLTLYEGTGVVAIREKNLNNLILEEVRKKFNDMP